MSRDLLPAIVDGLTARISDLVREVAPDGESQGNEWVALNPTRVDRRLGSFRIVTHGSKRGVWKDFATGDRGDALDLVSYCAFRGDKGRAIAWAKKWLGLDGGNPEALRVTRSAIVRQVDQDAVEADAEIKRSNMAKAIFISAQKSIKDTPADLYLKGRGIDLAALGLQPSCLRFQPACWHTETQRHHPALVAAIALGSDGIAAVHRTYLEPDRQGGFRKLTSVRHAKLTLGRFAGGYIRLWRGRYADGRGGASWPGLDERVTQQGEVKPIAVPPGCQAVAIAEGIEDGFSIALADPGMRVAVGVSLGAMQAIQWPAGIGTVTIFADNDGEGSPASLALDRVAQAYLAQGKRVLVARPPAGVKDANDLLRKAS